MTVRKKLLAAAFWLLVWEALAYTLALPFAVPTVESTAAALLRLCVTADFWLTVAASLGRILAGLLAGVALGTVLAGLTMHSGIAEALISPVQKIIRCTPVASFILLLWILAGRDAVPQLIALLMVSPVIWEGLCEGSRQLDRQLGEVLTVFRASPWRRLRLLILPGLKSSFLSSLATAAGLAWKAGVAAEIIAYTNHSIGRNIADARNLFDGPSMMAWTWVVILLSLLLERLIRRLSEGRR